MSEKEEQIAKDLLNFKFTTADDCGESDIDPDLKLEKIFETFYKKTSCAEVLLGILQQLEIELGRYVSYRIPDVFGLNYKQLVEEKVVDDYVINFFSSVDWAVCRISVETSCLCWYEDCPCPGKSLYYSIQITEPTEMKSFRVTSHHIYRLKKFQQLYVSGQLRFPYVSDLDFFIELDRNIVQLRGEMDFLKSALRNVIAEQEYEHALEEQAEERLLQSKN